MKICDGIVRICRMLDATATMTLLVARRATYVVDGRFFGHIFWKVVGTVCIHVSHVQLLYTVINMHSNMQTGGD